MSVPFYPGLFLLAALWGGSFLFLRVAAPELGPVWLIEARVLLAGLVLLPLVARRGQLRGLVTHWRPLLWIGCLNAALPFTLLAYAALHLTAGTTSILNATVPIFAVLVGALLYAEPLEARRAVGVAVGFAGVVVLVGLPASGTPVHPLPLAAGLAAALSYVFAANLAKRRLTHVPALVFVTGSQLGAALALLPLVPFFVPAAAPGVTAMAAVVALAVLSTSLAFVIYFQLLREVGPARTLTVTYLIPLFAVGWGALLLDEAVTLPMLLGGLLVLAGIGLANRRVVVSGDAPPAKPAGTGTARDPKR